MLFMTLMKRYKRLLKYDDPRARGEVWRLSMEDENMEEQTKSDPVGPLGSCDDPVPEDCKLPY